MRKVHFLISATCISHPLHGSSLSCSRSVTRVVLGGGVVFFFWKNGCCSFYFHLITNSKALGSIYISSVKQSSSGLTQSHRYKQLLMVWKYYENEILKRC